MAFIIDKIRESTGKEEEEEEDKGFDDLNYIIGQSSAMDVGEFPTPMDQRIGQASMIGGELMELQITNPATFDLEGDAMIRTIDQLGLDVTLHPDMNAGYTMAYKSGQGEQYGYDTIEQYFTEYIQELAHFKKRVERQGEGDEPLFNIGRMNPHISTSPMPSLSERMAQDVGVDPFGFEIANMGTWKDRNRREQNIYQNKEFLKKMYRSFLLEVYDEKWRIYENFIARHSPKFREVWRDAQRRACNDLYRQEVGDYNLAELKEERLYQVVEDQVALVSTAGRADVGIQNEWLSLLEDEFEEGHIELMPEDIPEQMIDEIVNNDEIPLNDRDEVREFLKNQISRTAENLEDIDSFLPRTTRLTSLNTLPEAIYRIKGRRFEIKGPDNNMNLANLLPEDKLDKLAKVSLRQISRKLDKLWLGNGENLLISVEGKRSSLTNHGDYNGQQILQISEDYEGETRDKSEEFEELDNAAALALSGEDDFFEGAEEDNPHRELLRVLMNQFEREFWKESNIFYRIIPAWMTSSQNSYDGHKQFKSPQFIWKVLVEDNWKDLDLNLEKPRESDYFEALEKHDEFRMDVAAAVGACYVWAHFTQRKVQFDLKGRDFGLSDDEAREVRHEGWTWIRWMNEFGLGVNMETMNGSPQNKLKIWRPKHIAVTAHAINLTAREELNEIHEELDGCPAKFTIDMEHVATMGAPPMHEMEVFWKQEEDLADSEYDLQIDEDKPIAKILRQMHLMDPGVEGQRGTHHGAFERGNEQLYEWLYKFVDHGFARNENEPATVLFELAEHNNESSYMMRITMDLIELGVEPDDLDPSRVDPSTDPKSEEEALISRFYGIDRANYTREWAKIEEHAFDPLKGLLEAEPFDYTYSSRAATENDNRPQEWQSEEYR